MQSMSSPPLLLGHRGARAFKAIPENTFTSFDLALAHGCDGFEFDVRLTRDGEAVICHDAKTNGIEIVRASSGDLPDLPRLPDVLMRYRHSAFLDIELKVSGAEKIIAKLLREFPPSRGCVVSSFLPEVLQSLHAQDSSIPLGFICETKPQLKPWRQLPVRYVIPHHKLALRSAIRDMHNEGKKVLVWTVNGPASMLRLANWGVEGIVSDETERLVRTIATR
jgi:glycerophosphoryl diester phosphodiesterase